jgi:hypothetical protein
LAVTWRALLPPTPGRVSAGVCTGVPVGVSAGVLRNAGPGSLTAQVSALSSTHRSDPTHGINHDFPARTWRPEGGECPTARPARPHRRTATPAPACDSKARQRNRCTGTDAEPGDDDLDAYVKDVVDALPPLTDEQRDQLALIFRSRHHRKK